MENIDGGVQHWPALPGQRLEALIKTAMLNAYPGFETWVRPDWASSEARAA